MIQLSKRYWFGLGIALILIISNCIIDENTTPRMALGDFIYFSVYYTIGYFVKNIEISLNGK